MDMPQITDAHRRLEALAGSWAGEETLEPSPWAPEGSNLYGRLDARIDLDGFFLITNYVGEKPETGEVVYRGHGVYGWDQKKQRYTMNWYDSMGGEYETPTLGTWEGDTLRFVQQGPKGQSRFTYVMQGADAYRFSIENSTDGERWQLFMAAVYRRQA
ncbi:MAG: DUF1579 family protein [Planctomycetota bacterium]|jgi:hypothetical protein